MSSKKKNIYILLIETKRFNASVILSIIVHVVISFVIFKGNAMVSKVVFCVTHCWVEVKFVLCLLAHVLCAAGMPLTSNCPILL